MTQQFLEVTHRAGVLRPFGVTVEPTAVLSAQRELVAAGRVQACQDCLDQWQADLAARQIAQGKPVLFIEPPPNVCLQYCQAEALEALEPDPNPSLDPKPHRQFAP